MSKSSKVELLAPAGGVKQFVAAVENGADAVYVGGRFCNARAFSDNFDDEEMEKAVKFAKPRGIKVYVAMNALVTDSEIKKGIEYARYLYEIGVDALIVQDLGLGYAIHKSLPEMPLHLSTQVSSYGREAMKLAWRMGYERVIPARELSKKEIAKLCEGRREEAKDSRRKEAEAEEGYPEIEVFCHGALCICYSGQCQLSRYNGGRSGNRGECAQPCRLKYRTMTHEGAVLSENVSDYPLSPKDLCLIDELGDLIDMGVSSLKIEGRMKSPEYVAVVTHIYRKYIDEYLESGSYSVTREDREALSQIFSRGHSEAYYAGIKDDDIMTHDIPKHCGIKVGKVLQRRDGELVDVLLKHEIELGDGLEIHSRDITGNIVTYLRDTDKVDSKDSVTLKKADKGMVVTIGDIKGPVRNGDTVFRTSSVRQLEEARKTFENIDIGALDSEDIPVDMEMMISGSGLMLHAETKDGTSCECWRELPETIGTPNGSSERFIKALRKTGGTPFVTDNITIADGVKELDMRVSHINEMRRQVLARLKEKIEEGVKREPMSHIEVEMPEDLPDISTKDDFWGDAGAARPGKTIELYFDSWKDFGEFGVSENVRAMLASEDASITAVLPLVDVIKHAESLTRVKFMPYISNISRGVEDAFLTKYFDAVLKVCCQTGVYVGNLEWIGPLVTKGIEVRADYGLNIYNAYSVKALSGVGIKGFAASLEKEGRLSGRIPLMTLEHRPEGGKIIDPIGREFEIKTPDWSGVTRIKPKEMSSSEFEVAMADAIRATKSDTRMHGAAIRLYI